MNDKIKRIKKQIILLDVMNMFSDSEKQLDNHKRFIDTLSSILDSEEDDYTEKHVLGPSNSDDVCNTCGRPF